MTRLALALGERFSRAELVGTLPVWRATQGTFGFFALAAAASVPLLPDVNDTKALAFSGLAAVVACVLALTNSAPMPDSRQAHLVVALTYLLPAAGVWAFSPSGTAVLGAAMFVGPVVALWSTRSKAVVIHLVLASAVLLGASWASVAGVGMVVACLTLLPGVWVLTACVMVVFDACERQGAEYARLVRHDPLTGLGNRRLLDEVMGANLRSERFSLLALDLNGFKALNDAEGHAAGDLLLVAVADALRTAVRPGDATIRLGGDEFLVVLPGAESETAERVASQIHARLARVQISAGTVSTGIGLAEFPRDGEHADALLAAADRRLLEDKQHRNRRSSALTVVEDPTHCPSPPATESVQQREAFRQGIGRRELEHDPLIWRAHGLMYLIYALVGIGVLAWAPQLVRPGFGLIVAFGAAVSAAIFAQAPPRIGSRANHAALSLAYLVPAVIVALCQPGCSAAVGCLIFVGPFTAARLVDRRHVAGHLTLASAVLLAIVSLGLVDPTTSAALGMLVAMMWVLGGCCVLVLEAAETHTGQLHALMRTDALTGTANRRALQEFLAPALTADARRPLAVIALDFNGFKALNDRDGHAAGDALLREAAAAIERAARPGDLVVRQGGDEFCIVAPDLTNRGIATYVAALRSALATVSCGDRPLTTGVGHACYPGDGLTGDDLLLCADRRLTTDKYGTPAAHQHQERSKQLA